MVLVFEACYSTQPLSLDLAAGPAIMVYKFMLLLLFLLRSLGRKIVKWYVYMKVGWGEGGHTFFCHLSPGGGGGWGGGGGGGGGGRGGGEILVRLEMGMGHKSFGDSNENVPYPTI